MVSACVVRSRSGWASLLGIAAILCGLTAHLIADAAFGSPGLVTLDYCGNRDHFNSPPACDLLADSMLPALTSIAHARPVMFLLDSPGLNQSVWFPWPPIHPPIELF